MLAFKGLRSVVGWSTRETDLALSDTKPPPKETIGFRADADEIAKVKMLMKHYRRTKSDVAHELFKIGLQIQMAGFDSDQKTKKK